MLEIKVLRDEFIDDELAQRIIELDRQNMEATLDQAGIDFPEENRRKGFQRNPTLIVAFEGDDIAGYVEYLRSWNDPRYIYIGSLQILPKHRHTKLILQLIDKFIETVKGEDFLGFETNVQKVNTSVVELCRKTGFQLVQNPRNEASWLATAGPELLQQSPIIHLINKWRSAA
jgi:acetyltransferase (GNAT) family protein